MTWHQNSPNEFKKASLGPSEPGLEAHTCKAKSELAKEGWVPTLACAHTTERQGDWQSCSMMDPYILLNYASVLDKRDPRKM